jgi:class 3 adenylate cyclase
MSVSLLDRYVPVRLAARLAVLPVDPAVLPLEGAVLFVDVAGSVALAERLMTLHGSAGTGQLSAVLDATFAPVVDAIEVAGGEVVQFAGDAIIAVFAADSPDLAPPWCLAAARRAAEQALRAALPAGISVRAGIGAGDLRALRVGGPRHRGEILLLGPAVWEAFTAGAAATAGTVQLGARAASWPVPTGDAPAPPQAAAAPDAVLAPLLPEPLRGRDPADEAWLAEQRRVTMLFARFDGLALDAPDAPQRLQACTVAFKDAVQAEGGYVRHISVDDKGTVGVAAFGVPPLLREPHASDALRAARALRHAVAALGLPVSAGVTTGRVYCGTLGGRTRRDYALVGRTVNLAARLMGQADGATLCDDVTARDVAGREALTPLAPIVAKGFADPVPVHRVGQEAAPRASAAVGAWPDAARFSGRDADLERLQDLAAQATTARRSVLVEGVPGLGKSSLLRAFAARAEARGAMVLLGQAVWTRRAAAYHAWAPIVEMLLGLPRGADAAAGRAAVARLAASAPDLAARLPLLRDVLPLEVEESEWSRGLEGTSRAEEVRALVLALLERARGERPLVVVLDDAQWCDGESWAMALRGVFGLPTGLLVLACRDRSTFPPDAKRLLDDPRTTTLALGALGAEAVAAAGAAALGVRDLPDAVRQWLAARAGGNPLFARELALSLVAQGVLRVDDGVVTRAPAAGALERLALPATVEALLLRRLDALAPLPQALLRTASALGPTCARADLLAVHAPPVDAAALDAALAELDEAQLLRPTDGGLAFAHQLILETVYQTMVGEPLRALHGRIAAHLAAGPGVDRDALAGVLAQHAQAAGDDAAAMQWLARAADEDLRKGAFRDAAFHLRQLLTLDEQGGYGATPADRARWYRQLGDAHEGLGEMPEARHAMISALLQLGVTLPATDAGWQRLALSGLLRQLWRRVRPPRPHALDGAAWQRSDVASRAYITISEVQYGENDANGMAATIFAAATEADRLGTVPGVSRTLGLVGVSFAMLGARRLAAWYFARADLVGAATGDVAGRVRSALAHASWCTWRGDLTAAVALNDEARARAEAAGLRREWEMVVGVASNSLLALARYDEHRRYAEQMLAGSRERGRPLGRVWALLMLAGNHMRCGAHDAAAEVLDELRTIPDLLMQEQVQVDGWATMLAQRRGDWPQVRRLADVTADGLGLRAGGASGGGRRIVIPFHWQPFWTHSEARLALLERASPVERAHLAREARDAVRGHAAFGRRFRIGAVGALVFEGRWRTLEGDARGALRVLGEGLALADAFGMPYEAATACRFLGLAAPAGSPARREQLGAARRRFAAIGARADVQALDLLLARDHA